MTRSEKKKLAYERYKQHQMESTVRCVQAKIFVENCKTCEHCVRTPCLYFEKWTCKKNARKPLLVENENPNSTMISGYPYGDLNGKCDSFTFLVMLNED